jgi:hypothetical protein
LAQLQGARAQHRRHARKRKHAAARAATATLPATPHARRTVGGFSTFTNPNATRIARAAFHFDTGH